LETDINQAALARRLNVAGPSVMKLIAMRSSRPASSAAPTWQATAVVTR
jgi:hypothetical protein